jgi:hypothetical protein
VGGRISDDPVERSLAVSPDRACNTVQQPDLDPFPATRNNQQGATTNKSGASIPQCTSDFLDRSSSGKCPRTASQAENAGSIPVARSLRNVQVVSWSGR